MMDTRDKQFITGGLTRVLTLFQAEFSKLGSLIGGLSIDIKQISKRLSGTLSVKVENHKDYSQDILRAQQSLDRVIDKLSVAEGKKDSPSVSIEQATIKDVSKIELPEKFSIGSLGGIENVVSEIAAVRKSLENLKIPAPVVKVPKQDPPVINIPAVEMPKKMSLDGIEAILIALSEIKLEIGRLPQIQKSTKEQKIDLSVLEDAILSVKSAVEAIPQPKEGQKMPDVLPVHIMATEVPQKVPQPVTHFSINSLNGEVLSTKVIVSDSPTPLPASSLLNRRSIMVYNNSSSTIYLGDDQVDSETGFPVPASSYSPAFDMGQNMILYGVSTSSPTDIRVLQISDEGSGR